MLDGLAGVQEAGILHHHQLHTAPGLPIATELAQCAEQVLKRRGLRTLGYKPLSAAVKASLRRIALEPRQQEIPPTHGTAHRQS